MVIVRSYVSLAEGRRYHVPTLQTENIINIFPIDFQNRGFSFEHIKTSWANPAT